MCSQRKFECSNWSIEFISLYFTLVYLFVLLFVRRFRLVLLFYYRFYFLFSFLFISLFFSTLLKYIGINTMQTTMTILSTCNILLVCLTTAVLDIHWYNIVRMLYAVHTCMCDETKNDDNDFLALSHCRTTICVAVLVATCTSFT